eukprot:359483-Chlamydomonas_euryale.AAC.2
MVKLVTREKGGGCFHGIDTILWRDEGGGCFHGLDTILWRDEDGGSTGEIPLRSAFGLGGCYIRRLSSGDVCTEGRRGGGGEGRVSWDVDRRINKASGWRFTEGLTNLGSRDAARLTPVDVCEFVWQAVGAVGDWSRRMCWPLNKYGGHRLLGQGSGGGGHREVTFAPKPLR